VKKSNSVSLIAIVGSILLLLTLEFFWLRMEYESELERFQRETHMMFRNTILELNDSLINKRIMAVGSESVILRRFDTTSPSGRHIQVWLDSSHASQFSPARNDKQNLTVPHVKSLVMSSLLDSLDHGEIEKRFILGLQKAGLDLPSHITRISAIDDSTPLLISDEIIPTPSGIFKLEFDNLNLLIIKNIAPQISFSIVLSLLVIGTFILVYRNLLLQQRLGAIKDDLISNISHELKTPITTVSVALEGLRNFKGQHDPKTSDEYLAIAENELKRLTALTDKILNTSLAENKALPYQFKPIDFSEIVSGVVQSFQLVANKSGVFVKVEMDQANYRINGDPDHLSNVLFNLLDNALKYSIDKARIEIHLRADGEFIKCYIRDNGIGIPKEYHSKIFEKFFRVPTGDLHKVKGHGLGLNYVYQIVKNHGGEIAVESTIDYGSTFILSLPLADAKA